MNKELKALQSLTEYLTGDYRDCFEELSIIGTALQDYETLKILNENQKHNIELLMEENKMLKQRIEKLDKMHSNALNKIANDRNKLKVLEIIKEKNTNVRGIINSPTLEYYIDHCMPRHSKEPTQEEYDLLKEVLL